MLIRGASGLGDAVYLYPIVKRYRNLWCDITVLTSYPEIFQGLNIKTKPFDCKAKVDIDCNYCARKHETGTSQFQDMLILAELGHVDIPFEIHNNWPVPDKVKLLKERSVKICLVKSAYLPMNLQSGQVADMIPDYGKMQMLIDKYKDEYKMILVGKGHQPHRFKGIYISEQDRTTVSELLGLILISDMIIAQQGFMTAFAEALDKKIIVMFSWKGLQSKNPFFKSITPEKVCTKPTTEWVTDVMSDKDIIKHFARLKNAD
jgi:hypothetical protein